MTANAVHTSATSDAAIRLALSALPEEVRKGGPIVDAMMTRVGMALLGRIKQAFIVKSRGGTDEAGDKWKPLSRAYVAYGRRHTKVEGDPKQSRVYSKAKKQVWIPRGKGRAQYAPSYALTDKQNKRWQELNRRLGAGKAWIIVKREGATTLMDQYGGMQVDILRDSGLLLNSLSPGVASPDRVFRVGLGEVIVGTNRKWAAVHHHGSRDGRIPQRRLWPEVNHWPQAWWRDILEQVNTGIMDLAISIIKGIT